MRKAWRNQIKTLLPMKSFSSWRRYGLHGSKEHQAKAMPTGPKWLRLFVAMTIVVGAVARATAHVIATTTVTRVVAMTIAVPVIWLQ